MIRVAIVGNIASGKSTVEKFLLNLGYKVLDTDALCHSLLDCDEVKNFFRAYDVFENGKISRDKLGRLVFSSDTLKSDLENLLYPKVRQGINEFFAKYDLEKFVFVSAPQLFEAKMEDLFDKILFVYCDDALREERLIARNHYTKEYAKLRMSKQMSQDIKKEKSNWVVYNNSTIDNLKSQIITLLERIR